jgi:dethiobiotin synthetase
MAADLLSRPRIALDTLVSEITWKPELDIGVVETVGGPRSPLAHDGDSVDLLLRLQPDAILLVADAGLGTLNAIRLCLPCIGNMPVAVFLNRFDASNELHRLNLQWLQDKDAVAAITDVRALTALVSARET